MRTLGFGQTAILARVLDPEMSTDGRPAACLAKDSTSAVVAHFRSVAIRALVLDAAVGAECTTDAVAALRRHPSVRTAAKTTAKPNFVVPAQRATTAAKPAIDPCTVVLAEPSPAARTAVRVRSPVGAQQAARHPAAFPAPRRLPPVGAHLGTHAGTARRRPAAVGALRRALSMRARRGDSARERDPRRIVHRCHTERRQLRSHVVLITGRLERRKQTR